MPYGYSQVHYMQVPGSAITSDPVFTGDYKRLAIQITGGGGTHIIQGSNNNGFDAAITNWSTLTTLTVVGMYPLEPGMRWLRSDKTGTASIATVILFGSAQ